MFIVLLIIYQWSLENIDLLMSRLERVNIKKPQNLAKVIGTIITIIGAMVMTLYKGSIITKQRSHHRASNESAAGKHWILGTIMLLIGCCSYSGFFILQVSKRFSENTHMKLSVNIYINEQGFFFSVNHNKEVSSGADSCSFGMLNGSCGRRCFDICDGTCRHECLESRLGLQAPCHCLLSE